MNNELDIAVVGMAGRFPGARNLDEFWRNLVEGVESITWFSDEELLQSGVPPAYLSNPNYVKAAPTLEDPGQFDADFFGFLPTEAKTMDPQQRILLELAHEAIEDAGYDPSRYPGRIGVFTGAAFNTYFMDRGLNNQFSQEYIPTLIVSDKDFLSTRISYKLNLKGPSLTIQTACSTSMVAVHLARQSLLSGESDMALAGAVSIRVPHRAGYFCDGGGVVSPDGHVRAFDAKANGTVFGSGGGILVLKRLTDALADGDNIYAVIKGSAVNNDGSEKAGYTTPSVNGQADVVVEALANAGVEADSITYVEAHGSGTPVGDPVEIRALTKAFRTDTQRSGYCAIGSVKTNVGHLDAAAAVAGMIKTILALEHRTIPPSLHFSQPNPEIDFDTTPFYVNTQSRKWTSNGPRRAGVMSTGMGGTNAHVVFEEAPESQQGSNNPWPDLLILSARSSAALDHATQRLREFLERNDSVNIEDVAYTLQVGRRTFPHRRCVVSVSREDAIAALSEPSPKRVLSKIKEDSAGRPVVFLFPGIGDHYVGMGHGLYESSDVFRQEVDRCAQILHPYLGVDIRKMIYPDGQGWKKDGRRGIDLKLMLGQNAFVSNDSCAAELNRTLYAQPALFTVEYALARLWQSLGISPAAIVGHSMGEYVAACLSGVMSLEDALRVISKRAKLVNDLPEGAMLAVTLPEKELLPLLGEDLSISLINGPALCVVAGPPTAVAELERRFNEKHIICRRVQNAHAFHSRMLTPIVSALEQEVRKIRLNKPTIPFISNVTGRWVTLKDATNPAYWAMHANHTARFSDALQELWRLNDPILLELGPGRTLGVLAMQHPDRRSAADPVNISSMRHHYENQSDIEFLLQSVGRLWLYGSEIRWQSLYPKKKRRRLSLPTYPFERKKYWIENTPGNAQTLEQRPVASTSNLDDWFYAPTWKRSHFLNDTFGATPSYEAFWLVFADRYGGGGRIKSKLEAAGMSVALVRFGEKFVRHSNDSFELNPGGVEGYQKLFLDLERRIVGTPINIVHLGSLTREKEEDSVTTAANQNFSFFSLFHIAQAMGDLRTSIPVKIGVISNRLQSVTGEEDIAPAMATVLGPCGVIPREYPNAKCFNVDLPGSESVDSLPDEWIARIISEFAEEHNNGIIAYRGKYRWEKQYEPIRLKANLPSVVPTRTSSNRRYRRGGVYLITGGTGGIGLEIARYLAKLCQPRLVLTKKSPFPGRSDWEALLDLRGTPAPIVRTIKTLMEIESLGAEIEVVVADVSDREQMQSALDKVIARFGTINGVVHAAGIVQAGLIQAKTRQSADAVLAPKVYGTMILLELLQQFELDFMVLLSSISSVLTPYGLSDYTAASAFLDAFAHYANWKGYSSVLSMNWSGWKEVGMLAELASLQGLDGRDEAAVQTAITTKDGLAAFQRAFDSNLVQVVISPDDLQRLMQSAEVHKVLRKGAPMPDGSELPTNAMEAALTDIWSKVFGIDGIGIHEHFSELGGHSLLAMQIVSRVRSLYQITFTLRDFFEAPTIAQMSSVIEERILTEIEGLTDEQARQQISAD